MSLIVTNRRIIFSTTEGMSTINHQRSQHLTHLTAFIGVAAPIIFGFVVVTTAYLRPEYNHSTSFISELGETGSPYSWLMNWFGFSVMSAGILIFAIRYMFTDLPTSVRIGLGMVSVFALGIFGAGWFLCDPGCTPDKPSFQQVMHDVSSLSLPWLCLVCFYFACLRRARWQFAAYSLLTGIAFLAFAGLLANSIADRDGTGIYQRLGVGSLWLWIVILVLKCRQSVNGLSRGNV